MKYKSELIKDILDARGHEKSSLHYQSECVETWIDEAQGAYPKLCDYESEWLNYIVENPIGDFPYETITDVTDATVNNVVPYAYKSAILKGNTLVNISPFTNKITLTSSTISETKKVLQTLNQNTKYILIFNINNSTSSLASNYIIVRGYNTDGAFKEYGRTIKNFGNGRHYILLESTQGDVERIFIGSNFSCEIDDTILTIYQEGMENWDIPYFTGMQSVKLPVLTTTGKNLFDGNLEYGSFNWSAGLKIENSNIIRSVNPIKINSSNICLTSATGDVRDIQYVFQYDNSMNFISYVTNVNGKISLDTNTKYIHIRTQTNGGNGYVLRELNDYQFQIEQGSTATPYEPYKSNILSTSEDVVLRGIGDVRDTLDCLTGELTQRIGQELLNTNNPNIKTIRTAYHNNTPNLCAFDIVFNESHHTGLPISDKLAIHSLEQTSPSIGIHQDNIFVVRIPFKEDGTNPTLEEFKVWLDEVNPTVCYKLPTESIKTVDLTITNQDGQTLSKIKPIEGTMHIATDGTPIKPTVTMEIPVEAITQNLASFIEEGKS